MRLIDGDELYREYQSVVCHDIACAECKAVDKDTGECRVDYLISDAPTIDAVSVVRCKECRYWHSGECWGIPYRGDYDTSIDTKADDFCSYGERSDT